jgi:hypothetical protein
VAQWIGGILEFLILPKGLQFGCHSDFVRALS